MRKVYKFALLSMLAGLVAAPSFAGTVSGYVYFRASYDYHYWASHNTQVKFCADDGTGRAQRGEGECYLTATNGSFYTISLPGLKAYYFFASYDANDWGSSTTHAYTTQYGSYAYILVLPSVYTNVPMWIISEVRPHKPSAVYPANGAVNVPLTFTLKWTSGIDSDRSWPGVWSTTYDIYAYGEGGSELKVLADIPCNPDASGNCTYPITYPLVPNWRYFWRVVPKLQVQPGSRIYEQSSSLFTFVSQP